MIGMRKIFVTIFVLCFTASSVLCQDNNDTNMTESRTFGHHFLKRISFAVIPAAFVVGVITTLLAALTVVSMKGLGVGVILLILAIGQMLSRTLSLGTSAVYPAPSPVVYSHSHAQTSPVWLENKW